MAEFKPLQEATWKVRKTRAWPRKVEQKVSVRMATGMDSIHRWWSPAYTIQVGLVGYACFLQNNIIRIKSESESGKLDLRYVSDQHYLPNDDMHVRSDMLTSC